MTKSPDIPVFLPSGCLSLESILKYQDGGYSKMEREKISQHLKKCRFCSEAMEGLSMIPDPFEQKAMVKSMRQGLFQSIRDRGDGQTRRLWPGRKSNIAAIAAVIVLLAGVFSVYSYLLKRDNDFLAEENINREQIENKQEFIPKTGTEKENNEVTDIIITEEKQIPVDKIEPVKKNQKSPDTDLELMEANASPLETEVEEEILSLQKEAQPYTLDTREEPTESVQAKALAKSSKAEIPALKTKALPQSNVKNRSSSIQAVDDLSQQDSLKKPVFISNEYDDFDDYIIKNLKKLSPDLIFPENTKIEIAFLVTSEGKIQNIQILKGISPETDKEVINLIENSPDWTPAIQNGKNMDYKILLLVKLQ